MAALGLRFRTRAFFSCGKRGPLLIGMRGPPTIAAPPAVEHRLQTRRLSNCGSRAQLHRGMWDLPRPGLETRVPCIGRRILNHCATREAQHDKLLTPAPKAEKQKPSPCSPSPLGQKPQQRSPATGSTAAGVLRQGASCPDEAPSRLFPRGQISCPSWREPSHRNEDPTQP